MPTVTIHCDPFAMTTSLTALQYTGDDTELCDDIFHEWLLVWSLYVYACTSRWDVYAHVKWCTNYVQLRRLGVFLAKLSIVVVACFDLIFSQPIRYYIRTETTRRRWLLLPASIRSATRLSVYILPFLGLAGNETGCLATPSIPSVNIRHIVKCK